MARLGDKLTTKQEGAIVALLASPSIAEAAKKVGIGTRTLFRWLQDPAFREAYRDARRETVSHAIAMLQAGAMEAVETLRNVMRDAEANAATKVSAAKAVLELSIKAVEVEDLEARIAALEEQQAAKI